MEEVIYNLFPALDRWVYFTLLLFARQHVLHWLTQYSSGVQLLHDASTIYGRFNMLIEFYRSLSAQLKEAEVRVKGYDSLLEVSREWECKLKELAALQKTSKTAT